MGQPVGAGAVHPAIGKWKPALGAELARALGNAPLPEIWTTNVYRPVTTPSMEAGFGSGSFTYTRRGVHAARSLRDP